MNLMWENCHILEISLTYYDVVIGDVWGQNVWSRSTILYSSLTGTSDSPLESFSAHKLSNNVNCFEWYSYTIIVFNFNQNILKSQDPCRHATVHIHTSTILHAFANRCIHHYCQGHSWEPSGLCTGPIWEWVLYGLHVGMLAG